MVSLAKEVASKVLLQSLWRPICYIWNQYRRRRDTQSSNQGAVSLCWIRCRWTSLWKLCALKIPISRSMQRSSLIPLPKEGEKGDSYYSMMRVELRQDRQKDWVSNLQISKQISGPSSGIGTIKTRVFFMAALGNITFTGSASSRNCPWFSLITPTLEKKSLADFAGKKKSSALSHRHSCSMQHVSLQQRPYRIWKTVVLTVSVDLPFAQIAWCAAEGIDEMPSCSLTTSDHSLQEILWPLDQWMALCSHAYLVLNANNKVTYVEY